MDAIVQLLRNAMCCIQDLGLYQDTFLWDANYTLAYYDLPEPLHQTTPLQVLISISQFYAFYSNSLAGLNLATQSLGKLLRIQRLLAAREQQQQQQQRGGAIMTDADRLVHASLIKEAFFAVRFCMVGIFVFGIGVSFFWLFANSWHVTETDWIGGVPALIHALTVMEVCLLPLLYYMYKDGREQLAKAARMEQLVQRMEKSAEEFSKQDVTLSFVEEVAGWVPFWDAGVGLLDSVDSDAEEKKVAAEIESVKDHLKVLVGEKNEDTKDEKDKKKDSNDDPALLAIRRKALIRERASELQSKAATTRMEGYREFVYLILNAIAFYGYLAGIIVYYWQVEREQPLWMRRVLLHLPNADADWHGNFAGDLMWTIEPVVILASPFVIDAWRRRSLPKKTKVE